MLYSRTPTAPGLQVPDGRAYPNGLISAWASNGKEPFSVTIKIRQAFDAGWREALKEAAGSSRVCDLHLNLVAKWSPSGPDWNWIRAVLVELLPLAATMRVFVRLGNYPHDMGKAKVSFEQQAILESELAEALVEVGGGLLLWAVGDDRGLIAAVDGWKVRRGIYGTRQPACIEVQCYGETGTTAGNIQLAVDALRRSGFSGLIALAEHHRWFAAGESGPLDHPELVTAETGEYLRQVFEACRSAGVTYHLFTGEYAFGRGSTVPNAAGRALFDLPRIEVKAWKPPTLKAWTQALRLRLA